VEQSNRWCGKKYQRRSHNHQQKMLHHVGREQVLVQVGKRRRDSQPERNNSTDKCNKPPYWDQIGQILPKPIPAT
jgi:hypothetical protein